MAANNRIVELTASSGSPNTIRAFAVNRDRSLPPIDPSLRLPAESRDQHQSPAPSEAESFPSESYSELSDVVPIPRADEASPRLALSFDKPPKSGDGFIFGFDRSCDICLRDYSVDDPAYLDKVYRIHPKHLTITFNRQGGVILKDLGSTAGTAVGFNGQAQDEKRSHFTWFLAPQIESFQVSIPGADIKFTITWSARHANMSSHMDQVASFLRVPRHTLGHGNLEPWKDPGIPRGLPMGVRIFAITKKFDKTSSGRLVKVIDTSDGKELAAKFFRSFEGLAAQEVEILRRLRHEHIISYLGHQVTPRAMLFMELGNDIVDVENSYEQFTTEEMVTILRQMATVLVFLKGQGIVHRDIQPNNLLVADRADDGRRITVKLMNFGFAAKVTIPPEAWGPGPDTPKYLAPEVVAGERATYAGDVWSLGVSIMEYSFGLPRGDGSARTWHEDCESRINARRQKGLGKVLSRMVRRDPRARITAEDCLYMAENLER